MKLKNLILTPVLSESLNRLADMDNLSIKESWNIAKTIKEVETQYKLFEGEKHKLIKKYATDEEKTSIDFSALSEELKSKFNEDLEELLSIEFEISLDKKIKIIESSKGLKPKDFIVLEELIEI